MKTFIILFSFFFITTELAHKDTPLQIDGNGNIIGLPDEFSPAKFDKNGKILRIRNKVLIFPECINEYFDEYDNPKLNLSASWYHSKEIMPYYINFDVSGKKSNNSFNILVNLESLELIHIYEERKENNSIYEQEIVLDEKCLNQYKNGIRITY